MVMCMYMYLVFYTMYCNIYMHMYIVYLFPFKGQKIEEEEPVMDYEQAMKEISVNDLGEGNYLGVW